MIKKQKICLLSLPLLSPGFHGDSEGPIAPLWALFLATYLKQSLPDVSAEIIDGQLCDLKHIFQKLKKEKFEVAGISPMVHTYNTALTIARLAKKYGAKVVFGGHHATALRKEILQNRGPQSNDYCVDAVIQCDGEKAFSEYVSGKPLSKINNLVYREKNGQIMENPIETLNLDDLPPLDYGLINLENYFRLQPSNLKGTVSFSSHRGCFWKEKSGGCIFCSLMEKKVRTKSPKKCWQEIERIAKLYKIGGIFDTSDDFMSPESWFEDFCDASRVFKNKISFVICSRTPNINQKTIALLKKINVRAVILGVESFNDELLKNSNKGATAQINKGAISLLIGAGIFPIIFIVLGLLGESKETAKNTMSELKHLPARILRKMHLRLFTPLPGSSAWLELLKKEKKYRGKDLLDKNDLTNDWIKNFCKIKPEELNLEFKRSLRIINNKRLSRYLSTIDKKR